MGSCSRNVAIYFHQQKNSASTQRYAAQQQALKAALDAWFDEVRKARWSNTADVKRLYASASIVASDGYEATHIALVVAVDLDKRFVWIKWLGTHRDYDAWTVSVPYGKWKHPGLREERLVGDGDDGFGEALHQPPKNGEQHWVAPMD